MTLTSWWRSRSADRFRQARDRGVSWLLTRQRPDGGLDAYYKALSALWAGGESTAASRVCLWIRAHEMTASGDFGRGPREKKGERFAYVNAWIVIGAHRGAAFDVSQRGMHFLLQFRDPTTGGFYSSRTPGSDDTRQDLMVVGFSRLAAIHTGRLDVARGVGTWLQALLEMQPDFPARLHTVYSRRHGLHTTFTAEEQRRFVVSLGATEPSTDITAEMVVWLDAIHQIA